MLAEAVVDSSIPAFVLELEQQPRWCARMPWSGSRGSAHAVFFLLDGDVMATA